MKTLKSHLAESLKNEKVREIFEEEKELLEMSLKLNEERKKAGVSQKAIGRSRTLDPAAGFSKLRMEKTVTY